MSTLLEQVGKLYDYSLRILQLQVSPDGYQEIATLTREYEKLSTQIFQKHNGHKNSISLIKGLMVVNQAKPEFTLIVSSLIEKILANYPVAI
jgi:hypothetical protein